MHWMIVSATKRILQSNKRGMPMRRIFRSCGLLDLQAWYRFSQLTMREQRRANEGMEPHAATAAARSTAVDNALRERGRRGARFIPQPLCRPGKGLFLMENGQKLR